MPYRFIYVDARCLQDPGYAKRGIGTHLGSLLGQISMSPLKGSRLIAVVSPDLPPLGEVCAGLFDECTASLIPTGRGVRDVYIAGSPMTHNPGDALGFHPSRNLLCAAIVYDFIPYDAADYLEGFGARATYLAQLASLVRCELFFPISAFIGRRLSELLFVSPDRITVTGASMRSEFVGASRQKDASAAPRPPYYFVLGGEDRRKNVSVAIAGVRILRESGAPARLVIAGEYSNAEKDRLKREGGGDWLSLTDGYADDSALASLYRGAEAVIVPSLLEGFSLPVVEAIECGTVAIGSRCGANLELIDDEAALFDADDPAELARKLRGLSEDRDVRARIVASQSKLLGRFHPEPVGSRFWVRIADELGGDAPGVGTSVRGRLPSVAFVSPYPPQHSGVADFTRRTLDALRGVMDCHLYTDAERPLAMMPHVKDRGRTGTGALLCGRHDACVQVLGNSHFHYPMLDSAARYGGPVIFHDARQIHAYYYRWGADRFLAYVTERLGRPVGAEEVEGWLQDEDELPTLMFEPVIRRAAPVFVHTPTLCQKVQEMYGVTPVLLPFPPNAEFAREELTARHRMQVRAELGLAPESTVVASFGIVAGSKMPEVCIRAVQSLRERGEPLEFFFVGDVGGHRHDYGALAARLGVEERVHFFDGYLEASTYRSFLLAADGAVQLRSYGGGQASAAYADCLSAGLPVVVTETLAVDCGSTPYAHAVRSDGGVEEVATALLEALESRYRSERNMEGRDAYLEEHSFGRYGRELRVGLGLG